MRFYTKPELATSLLAHKDDRYLAHKKSSFRIIGDAYLGRVPNDLHRALYTF